MGNDISSVRIGSTEYGIQDSDGYVASIRDENYHDTAHRRTTAAVSFSNDGGLHYFLSTPTMTGDHPGDNGGIVHMEWDSGNNAGQLFVPNDPAGTVQWRCRKNGTWQAWKALIDDSMIEGIVTDIAKPLLPAWMSVEKDTGYPVWGHKVVVHVDEAGQLAPTIADLLNVDEDLYGKTKRGFLDELETVEMKTMNLGQWETYDDFVDGLDDLFGQNGVGDSYIHKLLATMKSHGRIVLTFPVPKDTPVEDVYDLAHGGSSANKVFCTYNIWEGEAPQYDYYVRLEIMYNKKDNNFHVLMSVFVDYFG